MSLEKTAKLIIEGNEDPKLDQFFKFLDKIEAQAKKKQSEMDKIEIQWDKVVAKIAKAGGKVSYSFKDSLA